MNDQELVVLADNLASELTNSYLDLSNDALMSCACQLLIFRQLNHLTFQLGTLEKTLDDLRMDINP